MTKPHEPSRPSRRSVLAALGAAPLAAGGVLAVANTVSDTPANATGTRTGSIPDDLRPGGEFDRFVAQLAAEDKFSGTVLLTYRDKPVLQRSYGMANKARQIPNGPDTIFGLASVNKLFTGVALAQVAQRGKVSYGATLGTYLDGFAPEIADVVTVHQLLTHTSGFGRKAGNPEPPPGADDWDTIDEAWQGTLEYLRTLPLTFTPGTDQQYSNDGYFLLNAIVAQVSNQPFHDYLREHVFGTAKMATADVYTTEQRLNDQRIAHSYANAKPGSEPGNDRVDVTADMPLWQAAGDPYASAPDLANFARAVTDNTLLDPAYTHITFSPKLPISPDNSWFETYAAGARLQNGQWALGHNGGGAGISANLDWFPDTDWIAVVLSNYDNATEPIYTKARDLITRAR
jgi:CubicO group peptidase (beta-lactamase class C family)